MAHCNCNEVCQHEDVYQEKEEELSIPKANAIVNPGAVVVHVEHAPTTRRAVMASLWLEDVAHETVAASLLLGITEMEAPEDGDLSWVCGHGLDEGPHKHYEENLHNESRKTGEV